MSTNDFINSMKNSPQKQESGWNHVNFDYYAKLLSNFEAEIITLPHTTETEMKNGGAYKTKNRYKVNFKIYDVTTWLRNKYNTHIANTLRSKDNQTMKFGQVKKYNRRNIFLQKPCGKWGRDSSRSLFVFLKKLYMR